MVTISEHHSITGLRPDQLTAFNRALDGDNVVISGCGGSGKTYVMHAIERSIRERTSHTLNPVESENIVHINNGRQDNIITDNTAVIFFDGIYNLDMYKIDRINTVCRELKSCDKPFGGIQVIIACQFLVSSCITMSGIGDVLSYHHEHLSSE